MEIFVCIKRVPDVSDAEIEIARDGRSVVTDDIDFGLNEWDAFAVEEAIRLRDEHGGSVTVLTIGPPDAESELRRALAMGADQALRIDDGAWPELDTYLKARILQSVLSNRNADLILLGAVSSDSGSGQLGGSLAALLSLPHVALATKIDMDDRTAVVRHEVEGGMERVVAVELPAVVSVQTGINEPRYVSIRGIRRVSGVEIPVLDPAEFPGLPDAAARPRVRLRELRLPPAGKDAEMLDGRVEEIVATVVERLREHGGL